MDIATKGRPETMTNAGFIRLQRPSSGWKAVAIDTWGTATRHRISLIAAGVAFYGFLSIVPMISAAVLLYGFIADPMTVLAHTNAITQLVPGSAGELIAAQVQGAARASTANGIALAISLGIALFGARNGAGSFMIALNLVFSCGEGRGLVRRNLVALIITIGTAIIAVITMIAIGAVGAIEKLVPQINPAALGLGRIVTFAILSVALGLGTGALYRFAPACRWGERVAITPGPVLASIGLVLLTVGFGAYVANFGSYDQSYGSLGAVVVLLTWLWLSAYMVLLGAELDAAFLRAHGAIPADEGASG